MRYGICWPLKLTPQNHHVDLHRYIGVVVDEKDASPSIYEINHTAVIVGRNPYLEEMDDVIVLHNECLATIEDCVCYLQVLMNHGCCCGGFKSEQDFKKRLKRPNG